MKRREAVKILAEACEQSEALSVATMQAVPVWHEVAPNPPMHIDILACMGSAASFGLGLAFGAPERSVVVVDGDGSLLMQLGGLVTITGTGVTNITLVVLHNRAYETSGNQALPGEGYADFCALARAAGFRNVIRLSAPGALRQALQDVIGGDGPSFLLVDVEREEPAAVWPKISMAEQFQDVRNALRDA